MNLEPQVDDGSAFAGSYHALGPLVAPSAASLAWSDIYKNVFASVTTITDDITYPWIYVRRLLSHEKGGRNVAAGAIKHKTGGMSLRHIIDPPIAILGSNGRCSVPQRSEPHTHTFSHLTPTSWLAAL